jgi:hypothetical protein
MSAVSSVTITVPKGRMKAGSLVLRSASGQTLFSCLALARSVGQASNPSRDPLHYRGDTPTGRYCATFVSHLPHPVTGIGGLWIGLDPDDFHDDQARKAELNGRRGLGIHAGRGNITLKATHGCVRLLERDMIDLARIAGKLRFSVDIVEAG